MLSSPEKPKPFEGQQEAVKTPDQHTPEVPEYNEAGLRKMVDQAHRQINAEQGRVLESADKRLESAPASVGLNEQKAGPIKAGFLGRIQSIKARILELGSSTKNKSQETLQTNPESVENKEREKVMEQFQEKRGNMLTKVLTSEVASQGMDLVPFAGGGKMLVESISGKTLSGQKLKGKDRIIHAAIGAGSLALDFTGVGELAKGGAILGKSVGVVEKLGVRLAERGALKSAAVFEKTAAFMAKHPEAVAKAEQFAETKIQGLIKQVKAYRGGQREFSPNESPTPSAETVATDTSVAKTEAAPEQTQTTAVETPQSAQVENNTIGKETKDFSKKYGSLARDVLAGQLRQMKVELSKGRSSKQEVLQGEIVEKESNLKTLEQEYTQLEQKLDHEKNSFVSRLFKKTELSKLEQDLQERKATLEAVKKDINERREMLAEATGLAGANNDRAEIRKKLDEFYSGQEGLREKFEEEQGIRSVEDISARENVFFVHAMPLTGETQGGYSWNNTHIDGNSVDVKTKLKLIMGLEPTLACSTVRNGKGNIDKMAQSAGILIGRGRVLFAKESDANTITENSPFIRRSKDESEDYNPLKTDLQQNPESHIKNAVKHIDREGKEIQGYNELIVEDPECSGFFFNADHYSSNDESNRKKVNELQQLAEEFQVPLYMWKDGKMQKFDGLAIKKVEDPFRDGETYDVYDGYKDGSEIDPAAMKNKVQEITPDKKQRWAEDAIAERPFLIDIEIQKMYQGYVDGSHEYTRLSSLEAPSDVKPGVEKYLHALDWSLKENKGEIGNATASYSKTREILEINKNDKAHNARVYGEAFAVSEEARKHGNSDVAEKIEKWLTEHSALEECKQFKEERVGENGELKFIEEKDVPKGVRERLAK